MRRARRLDGRWPWPTRSSSVKPRRRQGSERPVRLGYLVRNVTDAITPPRGASPEMQVWIPEQLRAFLAHARHDRLYALWLLVATTGMRRGELAGLRWIDIDFGTPPYPPAVPGWSSTTRSTSPSPRPRGSGRSRWIRPRWRPCKPAQAPGAGPPDVGALTATAARSSPGRTAPRSTRTTLPAGSGGRPVTPGCRRSGCMTCATATPLRRSTPGSRPRWSASASATPTSPSPSDLQPCHPRHGPQAAATVADLILTSCRKGPEQWPGALR